MRFMLSFRVPTEKANPAIKDGSFNRNLRSIMDELKPEAAYFTDVDGARGGVPHRQHGRRFPAPRHGGAPFLRNGCDDKSPSRDDSRGFGKGYPVAGASSPEIWLENAMLRRGAREGAG
jgi:hypothetical protein